MKIKQIINYSVRSFLFFGMAFFLITCRPYRSYKHTKHPAAPDYANEKNWIALPWRADIGDTIPGGCYIPEDQRNAAVDVFYINPTVYFGGPSWNAGLSNKKVNKRSDLCVQHQGSAFNACARVFSPRYRQAVLKSFFSKKRGAEPLALAYEDIKNAFEYYLKYWNKGRPIIIAGHSQGAKHAVQLLKDFFDGKALQKKLVAAYPIGIPFNKTDFKSIPVSENESQTGCYITWNTFAWNASVKTRKNIYADVPCVNPLTMKTDKSYAPDTLNKGGVSFIKFTIDKNICDAQISENILWIHHPKKRGYYRIAKSYHPCDYHLFYMNIRANAKLRTEAYLKAN
jgi:hypothetical protein